MPPPLSASTVVVNTSPLIAPVLFVAKSSALSVYRGTKRNPMPLMRAILKPPLRVQLLPQPYPPLRLGMSPASLPLPNLPNPRQSSPFAAHLPSLASPVPFPAGITLVLAAPFSVLAPVPTRASPLRPTSPWKFRCRQAQPQHRVLHHPNSPRILVA